MTTGSALSRRLFAALAALAVALPASFASAADTMPPKSDKPVKITFYNYNLASAGIGADATRELIRDFMAANPTIEVEGVPVASDQILARVQADLVAGRVPDVAQLVFSDMD